MGFYPFLTATQLATFIAPSNDTSGASDTARLKAATGPVVLSAGTFYVNPGQLVFGPGRMLKGQGVGNTLIKGVGGTAGQAAITFRDPNAPAGGGPGQGGDPFVFTHMNGYGGQFYLDCTSITAGCYGIEYGDVYLMSLEDVVIANATGAGCIGLRGNNTIAAAERNHFRLHVENCTNAVTWTVNGGATSFDYSQFWITVHQAANQNGFTWSSNCQMYGCDWWFGGNFYTAATNTGTAFLFGTDNTNVVLRRIAGRISVETDGSAVTAHTDMTFGTNCFVTFAGPMYFLNGNTPWVAGNLTTVNQKQLIINGDFFTNPTLGGSASRLFKQTSATISPSATANTNGPTQTISPSGPSSGNAGWETSGVTWTTAGVGAETITLTLTMNWTDGTQTSFSPAGVTSSTTTSFNDGNRNNLHKDGVMLASVGCQIQSTIGSSAATATVTIAGINAN